MKALILRMALWCLLLAAPLVQAAQSAPVLLWLTSDITTAPRTAMVQRLASDAGLGFVHIDYPLAGPAVLDAAQAQKLERALAGAAMVWVDAPHASVEARLRRMAGPQLDARAVRTPGRVVWVPAGTPAADLAALDAPARMVAYLQAGGPRNLKNAIALARATVAGAAMPALPAPDILPPGVSTTPTRPACCPTPPRWRPGARASPRCAACPPWPCWCTATTSSTAARSGSMPGCAPSASRVCSLMRPLVSRSRRRTWPRCWSCPLKEALAPARAACMPLPWCCTSSCLRPPRCSPCWPAGACPCWARSLTARAMPQRGRPATRACRCPMCRFTWRSPRRRVPSTRSWSPPTAPRGETFASSSAKPRLWPRRRGG